MTIKLVYSEFSDLVHMLGILADSKHIGLEVYDESYFKDKKKAIQLKASCGARLTPFAAIFDNDGELKMGFYSEVGECTYNNIKKYIDTWINF